jgi:hypothetical protein
MDFLETIWILINCLDDLFTNPNGPIWARNPSLKAIQFGKVRWACLSYYWNAKVLKVLGKIIFQFSSILALFAIHVIMNCIRWLLCFEPRHLINKDKGANWSIIWLPLCTTMGICCRFLGIAIGVFSIFNNESNGLH